MITAADQIASVGVEAARARPHLVSVVLPVRNGERHIGDQLAALADQDYAHPWELVIVDNGCTDATLEVVERWSGRLPRTIVVDASERRGVNIARSAGARAANGDFLAFCDSDDVVAPAWLAALAEAAPHTDLVGGPMEMETLNEDLVHAWRGGGQTLTTEFNSGYGFLPYAAGGNCGIWADVAKAVGWDQSFRFGGSDIEFAWRAQLAGYRLSFQPSAVLRLRYRHRLSSLARQFFRYAAGEPLLYRRFRDRGMPRRSLLAAGGKWTWLITTFPRVFTNRELRGNWVRICAGSCGRLWGSMRWRVLYL